MIVVTGGAGFIGRVIVRKLVEEGHAVRVVDDLSKGQAHDVPPGVEFVHADLCDPRSAEDALRGADVCFHLAAKIGGIGYFHKYPATILSDNNMMLSNVFGTAARHALKVVYVSSSMVYERAERFPSKEEDVFSSPPPVTHYGFSKLVGEYYCRAFHEEHGVPYVICRPFNAYGPGERADDEPGIAHVIPDLIEKVMDGVYPLPIFGSGVQTRCFTYVEDVAEGICRAGLDPRGVNEDFNIGVNVPASIAELAEKIWKYCGRREEFRLEHLEPQRHDIQVRVPDTSKAARMLDWRPKVQLDEGLQRTIAWIRNDSVAAARG